MKRFLLQEKDWGLELIAPIRIFFFSQVQLWFCFSLKNQENITLESETTALRQQCAHPQWQFKWHSLEREMLKSPLWILCILPMLISVSFATIGCKLQLLLENLSLAIRHKHVWLIYQFTWYSELILLSLAQPKRHQKKILNPRWLLSYILKSFILFWSAAESLCT